MRYLLHRHIGGLEKDDKVLLDILTLHRHIGGLEKNIMAI